MCCHVLPCVAIIEAIYCGWWARAGHSTGGGSQLTPERVASRSQHQHHVGVSVPSVELQSKICEDFTITMAMAFFCLKAPTRLSHLRHYAKQVPKH